MKQILPKITALFICLSFLFLKTNAQTVKLHGKIIDSTTQQPVSSATVSSGKQTVLSDAEGNFTLNADKGKDLIVSFIGYSLKRITVTDDAFLNVIIAPSSQQLNEVVVTALGVEEKT